MTRSISKWFVMGSSAFGPLLAQAGVNTGKPMNKIAALVCGLEMQGRQVKDDFRFFVEGTKFC
jgi:hypothetical protein